MQREAAAASSNYGAKLPSQRRPKEDRNRESETHTQRRRDRETVRGGSMQFWYNVNPNSPWMNRCGLTSGKKSLVTAQNQTMIKKKNQGVQQRNELDTGAELEVFPGQAIKKKKKITPTPTPKQDWQCLSHTELFIGLLLSFWGLFSSALLRGSRCSPLPPEAGLRLLRRPFLPPLAYTAS